MSSKKLLGAILCFVFILSGTAIAGEKCCDMKIYGKAHVSLDMLNDGADDGVSGMFVSSNSTRFGIKGSIALENGKAAIWQYENDINTMGTATGWSTRNTFVGLKCDKGGTLIFGYRDSPMKDLGRKVEFFGERLGDARAATGKNGYDARVPNMLRYSTPKISDCFMANVMFVPDEGVDDATMICANGLYAKDAIFAGVAFETRSLAYTAAGEQTAIRFAGSYKADKFKVGVLYHTDTTTGVGGADDVTATAMGGGVAFSATDVIVVKGQMYMYDPNGDAEDDGGSIMVFGADYKMAKNVVAYVAYAMASNDPSGDMNFTDGIGHGKTYTTVAGENGTGMSLGMVMAF